MYPVTIRYERFEAEGDVIGAKALRQATHAAMDGLDLEDAAQNLPELRGALDTWGTDTPR